MKGSGFQVEGGKSYKDLLLMLLVPGGAGSMDLFLILEVRRKPNSSDTILVPGETQSLERAGSKA